MCVCVCVCAWVYTYMQEARVKYKWLRAIGGLSAAVGFFLCGFRLTQCLGGKLTYVSNSRGLTCQLSTVIAVLVVSKFNLPVSSVQAFVGSLVGLGIADDPRVSFFFSFFLIIIV